MSLKPLWQISLSTTSEAEEMVAACLEQLLGQAPVSYRREGSNRTTLSIYCAKAYPWHRLRLELRQALKILREYGLPTGPGRLSIKPLPRENWAESWKKHFRPLDIGAALLLKPSWSRRRARKGQAEIILDPGLSFGTGHHPTTQFCLEHLVKHRPSVRAESMLDMGTGTGILAIAAAKLGYQPINAFDFDPAAVKVAIENARVNQVDHLIQLQQQDVRCLPRRCRSPYAMVCANLEYDLLIAERDRILKYLRPGGILIVAGILNRQFPQVNSAYQKAGLKLLASQVKQEWKSGAFRMA